MSHRVGSSGYTERRGSLRHRVEAELLHTDGHAQLQDISLGGLGVRMEPGQAMRAGDRMSVLVSVGAEWFGPFMCNVVWTQKDRAGLEFLTGCDATEVERVVDHLSSLPSDS